MNNPVHDSLKKILILVTTNLCQKFTQMSIHILAGKSIDWTIIYLNFRLKKTKQGKIVALFTFIMFIMLPVQFLTTAKLVNGMRLHRLGLYG